MFDDDIIIIGKSHNSKNTWYIWYDCDVSDCAIGYVPSDSIKEPIESLLKKDLSFPFVKIPRESMYDIL